MEATAKIWLSWNSATPISIGRDFVVVLVGCLLVVRLKFGRWLPTKEQRSSATAKDIFVTLLAGLGALFLVLMVLFIAAIPSTILQEHDYWKNLSIKLKSENAKLKQDLAAAKTKPRISKVWDRPPLRIETYGFVTDLPPAGGAPLTEEERQLAKALGPNGTFERMALIRFKIHILNTSTKHHVSLVFRTFRIEWPPPKTSFVSGGGIQLGEGIRTNLGPEEDTEGIITVAVMTSLYLANGGGTGKMTMIIHDAISNADAIAKIN